MYDATQPLPVLQICMYTRFGASLSETTFNDTTATTTGIITTSKCMIHVMSLLIN